MYGSSIHNLAGAGITQAMDGIEVGDDSLNGFLGYMENSDDILHTPVWVKHHYKGKYYEKR
jgi:hypothetical protein